MKPKMNNNWYKISNESSTNTAEILIYDTIGEDFWDESVSAKKFVRELNDIDAKNINIRINSEGGSVFDGLAIYHAIKRKDSFITTFVDGLAASIASVIALAGDKVVIAKNAFFMIHNPWSWAIGDSKEMIKQAELLDQIKGSIVNIYSGHSTLSEDEIIKAMDEETWYDGDQSEELGFSDVVGEEKKIAASLNFGLKMFKNTPKAISKSFNKYINNDRYLDQINLETNKQEVEEMNDIANMSDEAFTAKYPALSNTIFAKGKAEGVATHEKELETVKDTVRKEGFNAGFQGGVEAENKRITEIEEVAIPGAEEVIAKAKADTTANSADVAKQVIAYMKNRNVAALAKMEEEGQAPVEGSLDVDNKTGKKPETLKEKWDSNTEDCQNEFMSFEAFEAYSQNEGNIKILNSK
jgi:ATP-dependent protease ClpP protease subunit